MVKIALGQKQISISERLHKALENNLEKTVQRTVNGLAVYILSKWVDENDNEEVSQ